MREMRDFDFKVSFNVSEVFSEDEVRNMLGVQVLSDASWKEAAYQWIWNKLKDVSNHFDGSFEITDVKANEF